MGFSEITKEGKVRVTFVFEMNLRIQFLNIMSLISFFCPGIKPFSLRQMT